MRCLANFGTLLEIGKFDMVVGSSLPMRAMLRGVSYISVHLEQMYDEGPAADLKLVRFRTPALVRATGCVQENRSEIGEVSTHHFLCLITHDGSWAVKYVFVCVCVCVRA